MSKACSICSLSVYSLPQSHSLLLGLASFELASNIVDHHFFSTQAQSFAYRREEICANGSIAGIFPSVWGDVLSLTDEELCEKTRLPEAKLYRTLSRSGLLLMMLFHEIQAALPVFAEDRSRVGVYGSIGKGVMALELIERLRNSDDRLSETLRSGLAPKQIFKEGANIPGAQLSILLQTTGPMNTFPDLRYGIQHSLEAAEMDFHDNIIDAALVFGASALDNPFTNLEMVTYLSPQSVMREGAAAFLVGSGASAKELLSALKGTDFSDPAEIHFGRVQPLIQIQQKLRGEGF